MRVLWIGAVATVLAVAAAGPAFAVNLPPLPLPSPAPVIVPTNLPLPVPTRAPVFIPVPVPVAAASPAPVAPAARVAAPAVQPSQAASPAPAPSAAPDSGAVSTAAGAGSCGGAQCPTAVCPQLQLAPPPGCPGTPQQIQALLAQAGTPLVGAVVGLLLLLFGLISRRRYDAAARPPAGRPSRPRAQGR